MRLMDSKLKEEGGWWLVRIKMPSPGISHAELLAWARATFLLFHVPRCRQNHIKNR